MRCLQFCICFARPVPDSIMTRQNGQTLWRCLCNSSSCSVAQWNAHLRQWCLPVRSSCLTRICLCRLVRCLICSEQCGHLSSDGCILPWWWWWAWDAAVVVSECFFARWASRAWCESKYSRHSGHVRWWWWWWWWEAEEEEEERWAWWWWWRGGIDELIKPEMEDDEVLLEEEGIMVWRRVRSLGSWVDSHWSEMAGRNWRSTPRWVAGPWPWPCAWACAWACEWGDWAAMEMDIDEEAEEECERPGRELRRSIECGAMVVVLVVWGCVFILGRIDDMRRRETRAGSVVYHTDRATSWENRETVNGKNWVMTVMVMTETKEGEWRWWGKEKGRWCDIREGQRRRKDWRKGEWMGRGEVIGWDDKIYKRISV